MKYMVLIADGMADVPLEELQGLTPMEAAHTPNMDRLAPLARVGLVQTIPEGYPPGSDVANMAVMGYDPARYYTGRSPLEAVSLGLDLKPEDMTFRCNLVCLSDEPAYADKTMLDYSSGEITTAESGELMAAVQRELGTAQHSFHAGISYRHIMWGHDVREQEFKLTPPHDISGQRIAAFLPQGENGPLLLDFMQRSEAILRDHPVNVKRRERGLTPATSIWLWGQGRRPAFDTFSALHGLKASTVCAVDLVRGLALAAGMEAVRVPGATGAVKTDFAGKAQAAINELKRGQDFVFLHIESADEAGHQGHAPTKVWSIEQIDQLALALILRAAEDFEDFRLLILPDHPTPIPLKTHTSDPVPFLYWDKQRPATGPTAYSEAVAAATGLSYPGGQELIRAFIRGEI